MIENFKAFLETVNFIESLKKIYFIWKFFFVYIMSLSKNWVVSSQYCLLIMNSDEMNNLDKRSLKNDTDFSLALKINRKY